MKLSYWKLPVSLASLILLESCKHSSRSETRSAEPEGGRVIGDASMQPHFDINDVSILMKRPTEDNRRQYLRLDAKTTEGVLLTKEQFAKLELMLTQTVLLPYAEWALAAVRIDNCGKTLPSQPCQPQIRIVFQPLWTGADLGDRDVLNPVFKEEKFFGDAGIHLAFNINSEAIQMYQDFLDLKKESGGISSDGMLGEHPVLAKQGMDGPFAKKLNSLILKYSLPSKLERIAIMGTSFGGFSAIWEFAATTEIKDGNFVQSPIPCQDPQDKTSIFRTLPSVIATSGGSETTPAKGCPNTDITKLLNFVHDDGGASYNPGDNVETQRALKIDNPEVTAFASTNCVACHKASRLTELIKESELPKILAKTPDVFKAPSAVSNTKANEAISLSGNGWAIRAFGWGEDGSEPSISGFTLNDSMRIASELNELIRQGTLK